MTQTNNNTVSDLLNLHSGLKLQIELVPNGCWFSNIRSNVSTKQWDLIRDIVYRIANYRCEICGGVGPKHPVECHEVWSYDSKKLIQKIEKLQALCPACHEVKHFGFAEVRGLRKRAFSHFVSINNLNPDKAEKIIEAVFYQWRERSHMTWELNIDILKAFDIDVNKMLKK